MTIVLEVIELCVWPNEPQGAHYDSNSSFQYWNARLSLARVNCGGNCMYQTCCCIAAVGRLIITSFRIQWAWSLVTDHVGIDLLNLIDESIPKPLFQNYNHILIMFAPPRARKSIRIMNCLCKHRKVYNKKFDRVFVVFVVWRRRRTIHSNAFLGIR